MPAFSATPRPAILKLLVAVLSVTTPRLASSASLRKGLIAAKLKADAGSFASVMKISGFDNGCDGHDHVTCSGVCPNCHDHCDCLSAPVCHDNCYTFNCGAGEAPNCHDHCYGDTLPSCHDHCFGRDNCLKCDDHCQCGSADNCHDHCGIMPNGDAYGEAVTQSCKSCDNHCLCKSAPKCNDNCDNVDDIDAGRFICGGCVGFVEGVVSKVLGKATSTAWECSELGAEAAVECEVAGLGPEDPFADLCVGAVESAVAGVCSYIAGKYSNAINQDTISAIAQSTCSLCKDDSTKSIGFQKNC